MIKGDDDVFFLQNNPNPLHPPVYVGETWGLGFQPGQKEEKQATPIP